MVSGRFPPLMAVSAAGAAMGLLALLLVLLPATLFSGGAATTSVTLPREPKLAAVEIPPFREFEDVIDRPLFNPARAPDPLPPAQAAKSALPALADYRLVGIVLMKGTKLALVERKQAKQVVTLHPGDELDGRRVENIGSDGVELSGGPVRELLAMPRISGISRSDRADTKAARH